MTNNVNTTSSEDFLQLMQAVINEPQSQTHRKQLYKHIKDQQFFIAAQSLPLDAVNGTRPDLDKMTKVPLFTAEGADGSKAMLAYTDTATLQAQCPNAFIVQLSGAEILNLVLLQSNLAALVLKAGIGWVGITKPDVRLMIKGYAT